VLAAAEFVVAPAAAEVEFVLGFTAEEVDVPEKVSVIDKVWEGVLLGCTPDEDDVVVVKVVGGLDVEGDEDDTKTVVTLVVEKVEVDVAAWLVGDVVVLVPERQLLSAPQDFFNTLSKTWN
jgi:hypothetical protein